MGVQALELMQDGFVHVTSLFNRAGLVSLHNGLKKEALLGGDVSFVYR